MANTVPTDGSHNARIVLGLLESVERDGAQSQRKLAAELGIALGLVNAYLRRCMNKGLLKVSEVPTKRYAYYLTPQGFAEKSRLTVEYLTSSFSFFRQARSDCSDLLTKARTEGVTRVALLGVSDLAEIATICAIEAGITITAVVDSRTELSSYVGCPVVKNIDDTVADVYMVTDLQSGEQVANDAVERFGPERVLIPTLLGVRFKAPAPGRMS